MKIYSIKDRMLDYYLPPFTAPRDQDVLAALSMRITNGKDEDALAQAPHQFELWRLGYVDEGGHLIAEKEYLADCGTLIRARRESPAAGRRAVPETDAELHRAINGAPGSEGAHQRSAEGPMATAHQLRAPATGKPGGPDRVADLDNH